ncbi:MAG: hypothetical protein K8S13_12700 [Desulfobacula sp.]|uniref:hypothetical protein n=1 Tax=Desulfobacula sp. TaxID=2593537 RepID=UPI0025BC784B|nr:hypothetical protein [Desulfobacula sp.]MCD4720697.1 hypothetical protein [Desulfobacula sp.]
MEAQADALVRKQFFISNNNINKLKRLCEELGKGVSAAKIVRDAIDAYDPNENTADLEQKALLELAHTRVQEAIQTTDEASQKVDHCLKNLSRENL